MLEIKTKNPSYFFGTKPNGFSIEFSIDFFDNFYCQIFVGGQTAHHRRRTVVVWEDGFIWVCFCRNNGMWWKRKYRH